MVYTSWLVDTLANFYNGIRELASSKNCSFCLEIFPSKKMFFNLFQQGSNFLSLTTAYCLTLGRLISGIAPHLGPQHYTKVEKDMT